MTPLLSLLLICGLVAVLTLVRWPGRARQGGPTQIGLHLLACLGLAGLVWLLDWSLWPDWSDGLAVFGLLSLEGLTGGLVSSFLLFRKSGSPRFNKPVSENGGVIRLRKRVQTKGVLPSGVMVVWSERQGRWMSQEAALEDERNALAG